ncbi:MAG: MBL fold metallo-hydrolase [Dehalococcoidia bacterium]|nr:MBL fold metallo-hydrolase [Dehalococcoidia bacterium]
MDAHAIPSWKTKFTELADGVFAYTQATGGFCIGNAGYITDGDEAIAIDALFSPKMTRAFQDAAKKTKGGPVRRLINTHHHVDHTLGNALFPKATVIAQTKARDHIIRNGFPRERLLGLAPWFKKDLKKDIAVRPPDVTFDDHLTLYSGKRRLELSHPGSAHTVDDVLVLLPEDRILFAGDVCFFYVTPLAFEGNIAGWVNALKLVEGLEVDTIVPGHGPIGGKEQVAELRAYFDVITQEAWKRFESGMDEAAAAADIAIGPFARWGEAERLVPNVHRLYAQFRGDPEGPIDVVRAFAGMAEFSVRE